MTTVSADWIKRIADEERQRDAVRLREEERVARQADLMRRHGRRLVDELRTAVVRDVEAFRREFPGDPSRDILAETTGEPGGGFTLRKPGSPAVTLQAEPQFEKAMVACTYRFTMANGLPPRESRLDLAFIGDEAATLRITAPNTGRVFADADSLSEYLLVPVFTARPPQ